MINIVVMLSRYLMLILMMIYTFSCFSVFSKDRLEDERRVLRRQTILVFLVHFIAYLVMYLQTFEGWIISFYLAQFILFVLTFVLYSLLYPKLSRLVLNNMCMLICIGSIMTTRLMGLELTARKFTFAVAGVAFGLVVPVLIRKIKRFAEWRWIYGIAGIAILLAVIAIGFYDMGSWRVLTIAGFSFRPSEFVKISFVFFIAGSLKENTSFKNVLITSAVAGAHVIILVVSRDLGHGVSFFVIYLVMLYVATKQPLYALGGILGGAGAAVVSYHLFAHVRVRVEAWQDPFTTLGVNPGVDQMAQSLFAIGSGGWFGVGLFQGMPRAIPIVAEDFVFSAIAEEMGILFGLCLILVCLSCYVMFLNIAMELRQSFYKLVALGLGTLYIFQSFLTIGGAIKFIPSTGITLPLVSYGGSSFLSTMIMFGIIQGLYIVREDEESAHSARCAPGTRKRVQDEKAGQVSGSASKRKGVFEEVPKQRIR